MNKRAKDFAASVQFLTEMFADPDDAMASACKDWGISIKEGRILLRQARTA